MNNELKAAIIRKYGSQCHFAAKINVQSSEVSKVVRGWKQLAENECQSWADMLGVDVSIFDQGRQS